jgi:hypothetical protein
MPVWPAALPQEPNGDAKWKETYPDNLLREKNDFGPDTVRRRGIAGVTRLSLPYRFQPTGAGHQVAIFEAWYKNELKDGALAFDFPWPPAPRETQTVSARITFPPSLTHQGAGVYDCTLEMEILP